MTEIVRKMSKSTLSVQRPEAFNGDISVPRKADRMTSPILQDDRLEDSMCRQITLDSITKTVYVTGTGPGVIVMAEMPGTSPHVVRLARWVRDVGLTVCVSPLFGCGDVVPEADAGTGVFRHACVSAKFRAFAANQPSSAMQWLCCSARLAHTEYGGLGMGTISMRFTGSFALTVVLEPAMLAPVLYQPSLPLSVSGGIEIVSEDVAAVCQRLEREDLTVLIYWLENDRFCRAGRFAVYVYALGSHFVSRMLPDSAAHPSPPPFFTRHVPCPYNMVTACLIDATGEPTLAACDEILAFFRQRLG